MANCCCEYKLGVMAAAQAASFGLASLVTIFDDKEKLDWFCSILMILLCVQFVAACCWGSCDGTGCPRHRYNLKDWAVLGGIVLQLLFLITLLTELAKLTDPTDKNADDKNEEILAQKAKLLEYIHQLAEKIANTEFAQCSGMLAAAGYSHHMARMTRQD